MTESRYPPHFDGQQFFNPGAPQIRGLRDVLRWKLTSRPPKSPDFVDDVQPCVPPASVDSSRLRVTLVNHSTVLLQCAGVNILTDPIWSKRASPFSGIGPKRHRSPGILWKDLPPIHLVLLSHNHYDHLDIPTLRRLAKRDKCQFVIPLGLGKLFMKKKLGIAQELDWGDSASVEGVRINCVPAIHFSARSLRDRNRTLWCGYVIRIGEKTIYFAGDTALGGHLAMIGEQFGPLSVALLPIGAFEPVWFMSAVHMSPKDAVQAHHHLGCPQTIAIHHGTFRLADDTLDGPRLELQRQLQATGVDPKTFRSLNNGEAFEQASD